MANAPAAGELVAAVMAEKTFDEWLVILEVLRELGPDDERLVELKIAGAVT